VEDEGIMQTRMTGVLLGGVLLATLAAQAGQEPPPAPAGGRGGRGGATGQALPPPTRGGGGGGGAAGPADKPLIDFALAERGKTVWIAECITCHGAQARGTDAGPNLLRSLVMLRDRYGSEIGPFLKRGHPMQSGKPASTLTDAQITDISHFLRKQLNDSLRGAASFTVGDVLTGDPKAGAEYFNGAGKCATCHSPTGDLAALSGRYETVDIQQRMLFPGGGRGGRGARGRGAQPSASAVTVTVTPPKASPVTGVLLYIDDFVVSLTDANGVYHSFTRVPGLKVDKNDPLAAHRALLETISDKNIHDLVAYLETLK
jgi:mono/diheme cytochrome c family protein